MTRLHVIDGKTVTLAGDSIQTGFTMVPNDILLSDKLSSAAKCLYALFIYYARADESAWPGQDLLAQKLSCSKSKLRYSTRELEAEGLLEVRQRGQGRTNLYIVTDNPRVRSRRAG